MLRRNNLEKKVSREGGLSALEGDLRKALGRSFLRWEKDKMKRNVRFHLNKTKSKLQMKTTHGRLAAIRPRSRRWC